MGPEMSPKELADARKSFGMGRKAFGAFLGFGGDSRNIWITIKRYELGERQIPLPVQRLVRLLVWHKSDFGYLPDLDREGERVPLDTSGEFVE